jgi:hypothetical protein
VREKSDREEKLSQYLQKMASMIPRKDFYRQAINTKRMKDAFSAFCTEIVKFVIAADKYCTKVSIGETKKSLIGQPVNFKVLTPLFPVKFILSSTISDPMQQYYDDINSRAEEIENLREAASFALNLEHKYKIEEIATVLSKLYEKAVSQTETPEAKAMLCKCLRTASSSSKYYFNSSKHWPGTSRIHELRN